MDHNLPVNVVKVNQELIGMFHGDTERIQCVRREVFEVVRHDNFARDLDGGGQDVPVLLLVGHWESIPGNPGQPKRQENAYSIRRPNSWFLAPYGPACLEVCAPFLR